MQSRRHFFVGNGRLAHRGKIGLQAIEERRFSGERAFLRETIQCLPKKRGGPFAFVNMIGLPSCGASDLSLHFRNRLLIKLLRNDSAATLLRARAIARVRPKMFERTEEKRTKAAFLSIRSRVGMCLDQVSEKTLRQILRVIRTEAFSAQKEVEWSPINSAQFGERAERLTRRGFVISRLQHDRPARGWK